MANPIENYSLIFVQLFIYFKSIFSMGEIKGYSPGALCGETIFPILSIKLVTKRKEKKGQPKNVTRKRSTTANPCRHKSAIGIFTPL